MKAWHATCPSGAMCRELDSLLPLLDDEDALRWFYGGAPPPDYCGSPESTKPASQSEHDAEPAESIA